jgi:hypothetical protein
MTKHKFMTSLAFSTAFLTAIATMPTARAEMSTSGAEVVTNGPQANQGDSSGSWSASPPMRRNAQWAKAIAPRATGPFR